MDTRDAVDTDAEVLAAVANAPTRAMRRLIRDRTARLATAEADSNPHADASVDDEPVLGFVGFDVRSDILHVTCFGGTEAAMQWLLEEPLRFASAEDLPIEVLALESEAPLCKAVEHVGFDRASHGPRFKGSPMLRYTLGKTG